MSVCKIKLNTQDRLNGTANNAFIPVKTSVYETKDIIYGRLESTTPIILSNIQSVYISTYDFNQTQSYDSQHQADNQVLGSVPLIAVANASTYIYQAKAKDNDVFTISNPSKLQSSIINIQLVNAEGNLISTSADYSMTINFLDSL